MSRGGQAHGSTWVTGVGLGCGIDLERRLELLHGGFPQMTNWEPTARTRMVLIANWSTSEKPMMADFS